MCGKFTQKPEWTGVTSLEELIGKAGERPVETITPMRVAEVIRLGANGKRETVRMRWGFVPADAQDANIGTKFIHARAETIDEKPTYRDAFLRRRGLIAVSTFNEGEEISPSKTVQYVVSPKDGKPLAIAVIWEAWMRGPVPLLSFAMVTTPPNALIGKITDRMPAVLPPEHWAKWLGEEPATVADLKSLLVPVEGDWDMQQAKKPAPPPRPSAQASLF
ncbi:MAG TPA: SOS response-associated peptidase [Rhizomicrobium sp.]|nr:SOS response-associated peptidase [Rhizomicrobium sp.]